MPENHPQPIGPTLTQLLDDTLRPMFGENLPLYHTEMERHDAESRELIDRARRVTQELLDAALDRLTFFGGDRAAFLGEAHEHTAARRADVDRELHEALVEMRERFNRRVKALRVDVDEDGD